MASSTSPPEASFPQFRRFPYEIREMVWAFAVEGEAGRLVVFQEQSSRIIATPGLYSKFLTTCYESREYALRKVYTLRVPVHRSSAVLSPKQLYSIPHEDWVGTVDHGDEEATCRLYKSEHQTCPGGHANQMVCLHEMSEKVRQLEGSARRSGGRIDARELAMEYQSRFQRCVYLDMKNDIFIVTNFNLDRDINTTYVYCMLDPMLRCTAERLLDIDHSAFADHIQQQSSPGPSGGPPSYFYEAYFKDLEDQSFLVTGRIQRMISPFASLWSDKRRYRSATQFPRRLKEYLALGMTSLDSMYDFRREIGFVLNVLAVGKCRAVSRLLFDHGLCPAMERLLSGEKLLSWQDEAREAPLRTHANNNTVNDPRRWLGENYEAKEMEMEYGDVDDMVVKPGGNRLQLNLEFPNPNWDGVVSDDQVPPTGYGYPDDAMSHVRRRMYEIAPGLAEDVEDYGLYQMSRCEWLGFHVPQWLSRQREDSNQT